MKTTVTHVSAILTVGFAILMGTSIQAHAAPPFHDTLAPHGSWISWQGGMTVWQPDVVHCTPGWRPYYHEGHWAWNGSAWQWHSRYSWGSVVFHYGHWWEAPQVGWVWVPGTVYAPAWVQWRYHGGVWGWAPMPPPPTVQTQISYGFHLSVGRGVSISFGLTPCRFVFVPVTSFCAPNLTSVGFYGSSGRVAFSATRTVTTGPSPYSVGRSRTTVVNTSVHVQAGRGSSVSVRHSAPPTPTRHPAPAPAQQTMAGAVVSAARGTSGSAHVVSGSRGGYSSVNVTSRSRGSSGNSVAIAARNANVHQSRNHVSINQTRNNVTIDRSRNVNIDRSRNVTVQRPANPVGHNRSAAGAAVRQAGRRPAAAAPAPQSGSAHRAQGRAQNRTASPSLRSTATESVAALRPRTGMGGAAARQLRR